MSRESSSLCEEVGVGIGNFGGNNAKGKITRNSSADEIANVNFLYDDIVHVLQNTIDSCIPPQIDAAVMRGTYVYQIQ